MGTFKLGKMTFGSLFKKPETVRYPAEQKPKPQGLKGRIVIDVDSCILCGMCERSCSTGCLSVSKAEGYWEIDRLQCVQCGYCITVCPKKCLSMDPNYAPPTTERKSERFMVPVKEKPARAKEAQPARREARAAATAAQAPTAAGAPAKPALGAPKDAQLEALIGMMDAAKAEKVTAALNR